MGNKIRYICKSCTQTYHRVAMNTKVKAICDMCDQHKNDCRVFRSTRRSRDQATFDFKRGKLDVLLVPISCDEIPINRTITRYKKIFSKIQDSFSLSKQAGMYQYKIGEIESIPFLINGKVKYIVHGYVQIDKKSSLYTKGYDVVLNKVNRLFKGKTVGIMRPIPDKSEDKDMLGYDRSCELLLTGVKPQYYTI